MPQDMILLLDIHRGYSFPAPRGRTQPADEDYAPAPDRRHRQASELPFADRLVYGLTEAEMAVVEGAS